MHFDFNINFVYIHVSHHSHSFSMTLSAQISIEKNGDIVFINKLMKQKKKNSTIL